MVLFWWTLLSALGKGVAGAALKGIGPAVAGAAKGTASGGMAAKLAAASEGAAVPAAAAAPSATAQAAPSQAAVPAFTAAQRAALAGDRTAASDGLVSATATPPKQQLGWLDRALLGEANAEHLSTSQRGRARRAGVLGFLGNLDRGFGAFGAAREEAMSSADRQRVQASIQRYVDHLERRLEKATNPEQREELLAQIASAESGRPYSTPPRHGAVRAFNLPGRRSVARQQDPWTGEWTDVGQPFERSVKEGGLTLSNERRNRMIREARKWLIGVPKDLRPAMALVVPDRFALATESLYGSDPDYQTFLDRAGVSRFLYDDAASEAAPDGTPWGDWISRHWDRLRKHLPSSSESDTEERDDDRTDEPFSEERRRLRAIYGGRP